MALLYRIMSTSVKGATSVPMTERLAALRLQVMASEQAARIGRQIRARRLELGIETQRELAERIDVPTINNQVVSNWERGETKPSDENMSRLAAALECDQSYFYESAEGTPDLMGALANGEAKQLDRIEQKLDELLAIQRATAPAPSPPGELGRRAATPKTTAADQKPKRTRREPGSR